MRKTSKGLSQLWISFLKPVIRCCQNSSADTGCLRLLGLANVCFGSLLNLLYPSRPNYHDDVNNIFRCIQKRYGRGLESVATENHRRGGVIGLVRRGYEYVER